MPTVTVKSVSVDPDQNIHTIIETQYLIAGKPISYSVTVSKGEYAKWLDINPGKTEADYFLEMVKARYAQIDKVYTKAAALADKTLTW